MTSLFPYKQFGLRLLVVSAVSSIEELLVQFLGFTARRAAASSQNLPNLKSLELMRTEIFGVTCLDLRTLHILVFQLESLIEAIHFFETEVIRCLKDHFSR